MKLNTNDLLRKWQFPLLVLTAIGPIAPSLYCYLIPESWALSWVFSAICLVLGCFGMLLEKKPRKIYGYIGFAVLLVAGVLLLLPMIDRPFGYILFSVPVLYGFALLVILPMAGLGSSKEPHAAVFAVGAGLYLFWQLFYRIQITSDDPAMVPAEGSILPCFLLFMILTMLSWNRSALNFASAGRFAVPKSMRRVNQLLMLVFLAVILLLGAVPSIGSVLAAPIVWAFRGLVGLLGLFFNQKTDPAPVATEAVESTHLEDAFDPNSNLDESAALPEAVMYIIAVLFILVIAYFLVRILVILVRFLIRTLRAMIHSSDTEEGADYHDQVSDVRDIITSLTPEKKERRLSTAEKRRLSPAQRIRHRYRLLKKRHPKWRSSDTVRKQLPEDAAILYERARYGQKDATEQDASSFETQTRGL